ncbi:hypothetical protein MBUL_04369 [Methylobacterium bullatum]|uniref:Uncharacterized protein n=1 Tax=Methylobacterium bullatum TaxID=570505 RepID=A0A679JG31_9HYPH|nr:hypothetical protein MBUL_04369 [Methylobacterium bullatum]
MREPFVPDALAKRLRAKRRNTRPVAALVCEPAKPVFAELLDGRGHGTGQFVRLSQGMVERIARVMRDEVVGGGA